MFNYKVATFDNVAGKVATLKEIGVDGSFGSAYLNFLNPNGTTKKFDIPEIIAEGGEGVAGFMYINEDDAKEAELEGPGWYYADGEYTGAYYPFNDLELPFGSMFYIDGVESDANVIASGVVVSEAQPIDVLTANMFNYTGNCSPVEVSLGDVGVSETFGSAYLNFLNPNGTTKKFEIPEIIAEGGEGVAGFMYINEDDAKEAELEGPGWYYADGEYTGAYYPFNTLKVGAGEMFYIDGVEADAQVIIPSAL